MTDNLYALHPGDGCLTAADLPEIKTLSDIVIESIIESSHDQIQVLLAEEVRNLRDQYELATGVKLSRRIMPAVCVAAPVAPESA